ncbi:MAG: SH3 domain-containing protein [Thiotrichaceae bacterium]
MSFINIRSIITSIAFLALLAPTNPAFSLNVKETVKIKTVSGGNLNVRYGPNGRKINSIKSGTPVQVLKTKGTGRNVWARISWAGKVGWVKNDFINTSANVDLGKTYQVDTRSSGLTVRKGAGRNHKGIRALPKATAGIKILKLQKAADGYWANISQGGKTGWVSAKYLKVAAAKKPTSSGTTTPVTPVADTPAVPQKQYYTVVDRDTLYAVQRKTGKNWRKIASLNKIPAPYALVLGQRLELP